jgi:L-alanine-DL-glutamate epimerase-like enolase superfamily enzyme
MLITDVKAHHVRIPFNAGAASFRQGASAIAQMMTAGAVSYAQPSVIKVGGITEYLKVAALADEMGIRLAPHSPYFGPGLLATLQLMSLRDDGSFIEIFYMNRAACLWHGQIDADANGSIEVPEGPGLGYEPDKEIMERYRVS